MEPHTGNSAMQGDNPAPAIPLGATLRSARERLGLSVSDVATQTKLAPRQIEALETEDFRHLPEMPFVRGFVRSYAKILHLDAEPLLACLPQVDSEKVRLEPASVEAPFPSAHSPQKQNLIWLGAALLLSVLVVVLAVWNFTAPPAKNGAAKIATQASPSDEAVAPPVEKKVAPSIEKKAASPVEKKTDHPVEKMVAPPAEPPSASEKHKLSSTEQQAQPADSPARDKVPAKTAILRLSFGEESWTEIRDRNNNVLSSQVNPSGSELRLNGEAPFSLVIGHAASARLYYRGKQVDLTPHIGTSNDVARLTLE